MLNGHCLLAILSSLLVLVSFDLVKGNPDARILRVLGEDGGVPGEYSILLVDQADPVESVLHDIILKENPDAKVVRTFQHIFRGAFVTGISESALQALENDPRVLLVEQVCRTNLVQDWFI